MHKKHSNFKLSSSPHLPRQESNIKVFSRFRPMSELETSLSQTSLFSQISSKILAFGVDSDLQSFTFDGVFGPSSRQEEVFETVCESILSDILSGYNGTIFAYGQTGSGKTYTMTGAISEEKQGIIPRLTNELFKLISESPEKEIEYLIKVSILEIYKDKLVDLLSSSSEELKIKQNSAKGIYVSGLTSVCPTSPKEFLDIVLLGQELRTVASTRLNSISSRSHLILTVEVVQSFSDGSEKKGILNLVDLAGSEKIRQSGVTGKNLDEAKRINLSLSALGNVISSLVAGKEHVPYRDSKLTRLLQDSLGGNFKTSLIVNCSPASCSKEETLNSLNFAVRAKAIKNKVKANIKESQESYLKTIENLRKELSQARVEIQGLKQRTERPVSQKNRLKKSSCSLKRSENKVNSENSILITSSRNTPISMETSINDRKTSYFDHEMISFFTPDKADESDHIKETQEDLDSRKKIQELEQKISELSEENKKLSENLRESAEKSSDFEKKCLEYYSLYHKTLNLIQKDANENSILIKKNENLAKSIKQLVSSLQEQEKRLRFLTDIQKSRDVTQVEFVDTVLSSSRQKASELEMASDSSSELELDFKEFSLRTDYFSFCSPYGQQLEHALESNNTLSKDLIIYHLKSQLIEASIFNSNLTWKLESFNWKQSLLKSKLQLKSTRNKMSKALISSCEQTLETLYNFIRKSGNKEAPSPTEKKTRMLRSFYNKSFKSSDLGDKSFQSVSLYPSFEIDGESISSRFKGLETRITVLEAYNQQLQLELERTKGKNKEISRLLKSGEERLSWNFQEEKQTWVKFFYEAKKNCQNELARKQEEVNKLNEILAEWINRFIEIQDGLISKEMHRKIQLLMINTVSFFSQFDPIQSIFEKGPLIK